MPEGSGVVVAPERQRARNPVAHSPSETLTVPSNTAEAAERRRSKVSMARSTLSAAGTSCVPAALSGCGGPASDQVAHQRESYTLHLVRLDWAISQLSSRRLKSWLHRWNK